jgi:hypothetical protein
MDRELRLSVDGELVARGSQLQGLSSRQAVAIILGGLEKIGYATRYVRKDGIIGWRATEKFRENLFQQMQEAIDEGAGSGDEEVD